MGDNAEFEKLSVLEARLAAALERISTGVGALSVQTQMPLDDPGLTSAAMEEAQMRADSAEARVAELEAELAQAVPVVEGPDPADVAALLEERDALAGQVETLAGRVAELEAEAAAPVAASAPADDDTVEILRVRVTDLESRVQRLRAEKSELIDERDDARDIAEELQVSSGMTPDARIMGLRGELHEMRVINERLMKNINRLRGENATDPGVLNKALTVELAAMTAARASEAAELDRILSDLSPVARDPQEEEA